MIHGDDWKIGAEEISRSAFQVMNELKGEVIEIPYTAGVNSSEFIDSIKSIGTTLKSD